MLGLEIITLFYFFSWAAYEDYRFGMIPTAVLLIPAGFLFLWMPAAFWMAFLPNFLFLLLAWGIIRGLQAWKKLDAKKPYLGMGDVLGIPLALGIVQAAFPVLGLAIFAAALAIQMPFFIQKRFVRLVAWLFLPTLLAILPRVFF